MSEERKDDAEFRRYMEHSVWPPNKKATPELIFVTLDGLWTRFEIAGFGGGIYQPIITFPGPDQHLCESRQCVTWEGARKYAWECYKGLLQLRRLSEVPEAKQEFN